jgi:CRISPR/Cas system CSM-associated protein Csm2 small subunit
MAPLQIMAAADPDLLDLPWELPLEEWPDERLAALPRGISRHVVRFVRLSGRVIAVKEINEHLARREYELLRMLNRLDVPCVEPFGVISGRTTRDGEPLDPVLITKHLQFSLPYRALFSQALRPDTASRLIDAAAVLLVRLHLTGFWWGDVSLSNTLFRRDAGAFAAYLVDAETGELHDSLSDGQREHDLDVARVNIAGELMDLAAGAMLEATVDPIEASQLIVDRYRELWGELTEPESFEAGERWRVAARIQRLNFLGFDVGELALSTDVGGTTVQIQPKIVDAGHHSRRLLRLTGLDVGENQARRLLNDLDSYRAATDRQGDDEEIVAHEWLTGVFEPVVRAVPRDLKRKLEPAEVFHEVLEHRWYESERRGHDLTLPEAVQLYVETVLRHKPDEASVLGVDTQAMPVISRPSSWAAEQLSRVAPEPPSTRARALTPGCSPVGPRSRTARCRRPRRRSATRWRRASVSRRRRRRSGGRAGTAPRPRRRRPARPGRPRPPPTTATSRRPRRDRRRGTPPPGSPAAPGSGWEPGRRAPAPPPRPTSSTPPRSCPRPAAAEPPRRGRRRPPWSGRRLPGSAGR